MLEVSIGTISFNYYYCPFNVSMVLCLASLTRSSVRFQLIFIGGVKHVIGFFCQNSANKPNAALRYNHSPANNNVYQRVKR